MSNPSIPQPGNSPSPASTSSASPPPPSTSPAPPTKGFATRIMKWFVLIAVAAVAVALVAWWGKDRANTSMTDDAFIEAHIVNIAPQSVSGHLVRYLVDENDHVEQGQLLAEIDPVPYRDQVDLARSKVDGAEVELRRQQAALDRL